MNKAQLIEALAERLGDKKTASQAVESVVDIIVRNVNKGEKVNITGFGVFEKRARAARTARNPRTGESVKVKKTNVPAFRAGTQFKEVVGGQRKLPRVSAAKAATTRGATTKTAGVTRAAAGTRAKAATTTRAAATKTATGAAAAKATATKAAPKRTATKATAAKATPAKSTAKRATTAKATTTAAKTTRPATKKATTTRKTTKK
ncbi:HU family DNA-binding protein [Saccharopolyspora sp. ASAGF58]|uniref:HU family DNA-binding protein n=1 Tax=Saccharopolyspora sp. ASAGF58 TaxID=2719023 RepID=UPI0014402056|nr:HU family DNA-binding protein [Saccharopolyspora sp. ASAGF58]QIZ34329.1 HU family DNA-binding protein [Saccharopolyspora sp. ASAGF58]